MKTWTFKSKSSDAEHTTTLADDGKLICSCPRWRNKRAGQARGCTHIDQVLAELGLASTVAGDYQFVSANGNGHAAPEKKPKGAPPVKLAAVPPADVAHVPEPMLASAMTAVVTGDAFDARYQTGDWIMEEKMDGHRVIVVKRDGGITAFSRPRADGAIHQRVLADPILNALGYLADGIYDGELVVPGGKAWNVIELGAWTVFVIFDVLDIAGEDLRKQPYTVRRDRMLDELRKLPDDQQAISTVESVEPSWAAIEAIWKRGGEGCILKKLTSTYREGWRSPEWVKVKAKFPATLTVTGFMAARNGPYSKIALVDDQGRKTTVKTKNNYWLGEFAKNGASYIGKRLVVTHLGFTDDNNYRGPVLFDHFAGEGE
jgi:ATP-dependent DNA ligase